MNTETILESIDLRKVFGALVAVAGVSIRVEKDSIHSIIGPNGAGKTTFFNLLSGTLPPTSGRVLFKGEDITRVPMHRTIHLGIGRSFQITNLFPNLTALENVRLACQALGKDNFRFLQSYRAFPEYEARALEVLDEVGLAGRAQAPARTLPHGDQRKLELAMILAPNPEVLLLDEPTAGMAGEQVPDLIDLIRKVHRGGGKTIVLVEHNMSVVMNISDRITVMHLGEILAEGTPVEIAAHDAVRKAYLGELYN
ncbi:MAG TPA: ABC transporter ATP-binding protein [Anaerolineales bacterium]|nr:ABC transporter ATP-binding protein [Anaerolineales bacterium]